MVVEEASHKSFESYLEKVLSKPAGMKDTGFYQGGGYKKQRLTTRVHDFDGTLSKSSVHRIVWNQGRRGAVGVIAVVTNEAGGADQIAIALEAALFPE